MRFDTRVSGTEAQHLVSRCIQAVEAEKKVMIGFRLGDLWTDIFTYTKGKNVGKPGVSLKARLLFISWIKVDGTLVYKAEPNLTEADEYDTEVSTTTAASTEPQASSPEPSQHAAEAADEAVAVAVTESF
ncbi:hypothetical protein D9M73_181960 [compost metagenome]